jgi:putative ABC transport system permease protein
MNKDRNDNPLPRSLRFLRWFCPEHLYEEIEGDLIQRFNRDLRSSSSGKAKRKLFWNTLKFFRPGIVLRNRFSLEVPRLAMIQNYTKISIRHLLKRKLYSFINTFGLATGIAVSLVIWRYVAFELSYDDFHKKGDTIYRAIFTDYKNGEKLESSPRFGFGLGAALVEDVPEIRTYVRTHPLFEEAVINFQDNENNQRQFVESNIEFADSTFFDVFTFEGVYGDQATALDKPSSVVITESIAHRYFGKDTNPLGRTLHLSTRDWIRGDFTITAVIRDLPQNSHFDFDFLLPMHDLLKLESYRQPRAEWNWVNFYTYLVLYPETNLKAVEAKMPPLLVKYTGPNTPGTDFILSLQPLREIHLTPQSDNTQSFSGIYFFIAIAILILAIAWINYVNLSTARATERAREVGVKKAIGVYRRQLVSQFLVESFIINFIGIVIAVGLAMSLLPMLGNIVDKNLSIDFTELHTWIILTGLFFAGSLGSGAYPALLLSSFKTTEVMKGTTFKPGSGLSLRKVLVVFQFTASLFLIIGSFAIYRQIDFMMDSNKGMRTDQIVIVDGPRILEPSANNERLVSFKNELLKLSAVGKITSSWSIPGAGFSWVTGMTKLKDSGKSLSQPRETIHIVDVDLDFVNTYDITVLSGRTWSPDRTSDMKSVLINEAALGVFDLGTAEEALNQQLIVDHEDTVFVLGVLKNFNWSSLESDHVPMMLWPNRISGQKFSIQITENIPESIKQIEALYLSSFPGNPFDFYFLNDFFNAQYKSDEQFGKIFGLFALLAIVIACLGLFGLASYTTAQRFREISIRKILGASVRSLMTLLSRQFLKLVLIACMLALPLTWFAVRSWLNNFAFRIAFSLDLYIIPVIALILLALVTVIFQVINAVRGNPVNSLRSE